MKRKRLIMVGLVAASVLILSTIGVRAQRSNAATQPRQEDQIADLRAAVARLEAALQQGHKGPSAIPAGNGSRTTKGPSMSPHGMAGMPGVDKGGGRPPGKMGKMGGVLKMGMGMMGSMGTEGAMPLSALPGFPGASHLYHIGATGFFLDHRLHVVLTIDQQVALNKIKEDVLLANGTADRTIEEKEQQLWELTAADQPDVKRIEAKIREIEKLRTDRRLTYIRAVGNAARVLSDEQRRTLIGVAGTAATDPSSSGDSSRHDH